MEESDYQLIEDYLNGDLKDQQLKDFEQKIQMEPSFAEAFQLHQKVEYWLKQRQKKQLQQEWQDLIKQQEPLPAQKVKSLVVVKWAVGLAASLMIGFGLFWFVNTTPSPPTLASNYWEQTANFTYKKTDRSTTTVTTVEQNLIDAYQAYKSKDYEASLKLLNETSGLPEEGKLLKGANYFALKAYASAVQSFQSIIDQPIAYKDQAQWYLALSLLALEKVEEAKNVLETINADKSWKHQEAQELLNQL